MLKALQQFWSLSDADFSDKVADILEQHGWNRFYRATNNYGRRVDINDPFAVSYCAVGAIELAYDHNRLRFNKRRLQHWIESFCEYLGYSGGLEDITDNDLIMGVNKITIGRWNDKAEQSPGSVINEFRSYANHLRSRYVYA